MSKHATGGARRAETPPRSIVARVGTVVLPVAILALVATLVIFGDSIFDGGAEPTEPDKGQTASAPLAGDEAAQAEVAEVAATVLDTWSRPGVAYAGWWRQLEPLLTPGGRQAYAATDPAQVPDLEEIEVEEVVLHGEGGTATVYFTTSEGRFGVDMSRQAADAQWLANRVVFPDGESMFA
jgi:hypothetical protein